MGRRKIEIEPITHERNRSVTFLKRKNGLFKKAYELGVLCSVDVVVIIFDEKPTQPGTQKLYEYCSSKVKDIIKKHSKFTGERDSKGPGDFSRGGGKGGGRKVDEDADADGDEDDEDDEEEQPEPPKKRQRKNEATTSTKVATNTSTKRVSQPPTKSLKRGRSSTPASTHSRETSPDLRTSALSAMPSGYLQQQSQNPFPQYPQPHSSLANSPSSPFDAFHPQTQYPPHHPFQYRPQQTQYSTQNGGKYQYQNQMYGPSHRHLFDNQNPHPHPYSSSSFNDLLSIFEAMPSAGNAHPNGLVLPVGNGNGTAASWPQHASAYQQQHRGGGSSSGGGSGSGAGVGAGAGDNNWLEYLSGSGGPARRPPVDEELTGVFQGGAARRGQPSTPDEDADDAEREGGRSRSTSDSEYEPQPRRRGRAKKG
ncbi:hypothetical protein E1B28_012003 [Marasmius oreades]|uniref:MADS-box domain-containing protein n=1 Tax=Marasmius oreades TaxID=181124 RepID=A0A9P7UMS5_9AGAR|nr:uncharacterized protein E1B28_012003 [Marasmius oreades]KAG7087962.1 hypothetical protein E1B28_012003 [Marasmius oreades]